MSKLFEPLKIHGLWLRNRFVRSATHDSSATKEGKISDRQIGLYTELARGGVGLIVSGYAYVHPMGQSLPFQTAIYSDDSIPGLRRLTNVVHSYGARIALQIAHGGRRSPFLRDRGETPLGPSRTEDDPYDRSPHREMRSEEIEDVIEAFAEAAVRAREAGFDAVQLHGAHGYLLSQFLSPHTNRRTDQWGGNLENRLRLHARIYQKVREKVGEDYPVLIKLGLKDDMEGGLSLAEGCQAALRLAEMGLDAIEISGGVAGLDTAHFSRRDIKSQDQEAYYLDWAMALKGQGLSVSLILVGGIRSFEVAEEIVENGHADAIALCRPLIREPGLINRWKEGNRKRSRCISENLCLEMIHRGEPLECGQEKKLRALQQSKAARSEGNS